MSRQQTCQQTSRKLSEAASGLSAKHVAIGLDGFVDEIIAVVDKRQDFQKYEPVKTIEHFGKKISAAAGASSNYELVVKQMKLGGNGPIMANALAAMGLKVSYFGALGYPTIHPVFKELAERADVYTMADPGHTDALEFADGKLMLGKLMSLNEVTWDNLISRVGMDAIVQFMGRASLIGMVNWTMLPYLSEIWSNMLEQVIPGLPKMPRKVFIDLADPEKRLPADIVRATAILSKFQKHIDVILGLNLKESQEVSEVLHLPHADTSNAAIEKMAVAIREKLGLHCVVIHPRHGAAAATEKGSAYFDGPFVGTPKISTGAGDHFNAGFCLGSMLGFELGECLCTGVATSGHYVRTAQSPSAKELATFIASLPAPQG